MKKVVGIAVVLSLLSITHAPAREQRSIREASSARPGQGDPTAVGPRVIPEPDALARAVRAGELSRAEYAYWRARSLFHRREVARRFGRLAPVGAHDATMMLRDLALHRDRLPQHLRDEADSLLARPTDRAADPQGQGYAAGVTVKTSCVNESAGGKTLKLCFHWVTKTSDKSSSTQVSRTKSVFGDVYSVEVGILGYKKPLADTKANTKVNKNGGLDIYLADVGASGIYGYCTTDDARRKRSRQVSAYCVVDNDFSSAQFAPDTYGLTALKVTGAHEFFHAVQFAYDWKEAKWLIEGTATWIEDLVYDINGVDMFSADPNYSFLADSHLLQPEISLDAYGSLDDGQHFEYGAWVFWRYLMEYFDTPVAVREVWDRAVSASALSALTAEVNQRMGPTYAFADFWTDYAISNRAYTIPVFYEEGLGYWNSLLLFPPWDAVFRFGVGGGTGARSMPVSRLSTRYIAFYPEASLPDGYELDVNLPSELASSSAVVTFTAPYTGNDFCFSWYYPDANGDFVDVEFTRVDNPCTATLNDMIDITQAYLVLGNPTSSARTETYVATVVAD